MGIRISRESKKPPKQNSVESLKPPITRIGFIGRGITKITVLGPPTPLEPVESITRIVDVNEALADLLKQN